MDLEQAFDDTKENMKSGKHIPVSSPISKNKYKSKTSKGTKQGIYHVLNIEKYAGNTKPVFKSGWEEKIFRFMDNNPYVVKWAYEPFGITYFNPVTRKNAQYLPDVVAYIRQPGGEEKAFMIEVKPYKQCIPPKTPKKPTAKDEKTYYKYQKSMQRYKKEVQTYSQNQAKWSAAGAWCRKHHFNWIIANEKNVPEFIR